VPIKRKFKSDAFEAIHSSVEGMFRAGTIDKATMQHFDEACLAVPPELDAKEITALRKKGKVSQTTFASRLNVSASTIQKWETGAKRPSDMAMKLLSVVQKHGLSVLD
jgi:putative transcriptional regulator